MHTSMKKIVCALVAVLMVLAVLPVASFAEQVNAAVTEARKLNTLDNAWKSIESVEKSALSKKASPKDVTLAAYKATVNNPYVDKGSIVWESDNQFAFTVDGMHCAYCYRVRNTKHIPSVNQKIVDVLGTKGSGTAGSKNVLLVGPYYGQDSSFTNQYRTEAQSIANTTGGTLTRLESSSATGPAIASNYTNKGVVIYDSHGIQTGSSSYLCLTTNSGITSSDYSNGWAVSSGSAAFIDGRYIKNHVNGTLSNCFVWMAICEGMKKGGNGVTGSALLSAGAGAVYGYSQSVSFTGDYKYEATFWTEMKNGATVKDAIVKMKSVNGDKDTYVSPYAWPIVMSSQDAFPSNPDSKQTVYCDWTLVGNASPDPVSSVSVNNVTVKVGSTANVVVNVTPSSSDYTVTSYSSSNTSVATVSSTGVVTGVSAGTATLTVKVRDNTSYTTYTRTATITVSAFTGYTLASTPEYGGQYIIVLNGYAVGNTVYSNNHYLTSYYVTVNSDNTLTIPSSVNENNILWTVGGSSYSGWTFQNVGNGKYMGLDSSEYLAPTTTSLAWKYENGDLNNQVDSEGYYYLSLGNNTSAYFTTNKSTNGSVKLYKLVGSSATPTATPTPKPTATPTPKPTATPTPKPTATPVPTTAPSNAYYTPVSSIEAGAEYLIGYNDGSNVYLLMNSNPNYISNRYYYSYNYNYCAYGIKAVKSGSNIVGVDTSTYSSATLDNVTWKFVANGSYYKIQSGSNSSYYLRVYSSANYSDMYPASGTSYATNWAYGNGRLYYYVSSSVTKYATYMPTAGNYSNFFCGNSSASSYSNITLYKKVSGGSVTPTATPTTAPTTYYTITFKDWDYTVLKTEQVPKGGNATPPADPVRAGYTFTGWNGTYTNVQYSTTVYATYTQNSSTSTAWVPANTITVGEKYLIGFKVNGNVYLIMNYNPAPVTSNSYYYVNSSNYYGYTAKATMSGNNIVGCSGWTDNLEHCAWKFTTTSGGRIQSAYNSSYNLAIYNSTKYNDLHPSTSTGFSNWVWNSSAHTLTHAYSSYTKYATFMPTVGNYSNFCYAPTSLDSTYGYVQLYKLG